MNRRKRMIENLDQDIRDFIERETQDNIERGMPPEKARYAALRKFGNVTRVKEDTWEVWSFGWLEQLWQDIHYGLRMLAKNPGFAAVAVLTLALGIGAVAVIFSVVDNALLHPFPYRDADEICDFHIHDLDDQAGLSGRGRLIFSVSEFLDYQEQNHVFSDMTGIAAPEDVLYVGPETAQELTGAFVTTNTFQFLGVPPVLGRWITPDDGRPDAPPVFLMNYRMWQEQFHGDTKILGTSFTLSGVPRQLIGIMPPRFQYCDADVYLPMTLSHSGAYAPGWLGKGGGPAYLYAMERRKPGVALQAVAADLNVIAQRLAKTYPRHYPKHFMDYPKHFNILAVGLASEMLDRWYKSRSADFEPMLYILLAAVGMLLLIACSNVANLLLARATSRRKEIAIRASIGAGRGRLIRQLLVESAILAGMGGVVGIIFAYWGLKAVVAAMPQGTLPSEAVVTMNSAVLLVTVGVTALTTILCGLAPALHAVRPDLQYQLQDSSRGINTAFRHGGLRSALVVAEVALSIVLLAGAGLMIRSLFALEHVDLGFNPQHILSEGLIAPAGPRKAAQQKTFFQQLLPRIAALPGVIAVTEALTQPPFWGPEFEVTVPGRTHTERWNAMFEGCSEGWFRTMGVPLERGRLLSETDIGSARMVAVINQTLARRFFGGTDPIGQKIKFNRLALAAGTASDGYFEIIGIVADIKNQGLQQPVMPEAFLPFTVADLDNNYLMVRTAGNPLALAKSVDRAVRAVDPGVVLGVAPGQTGSLESFVHDSVFAQPRFRLVLLGAFAGIGLILVITGVFSVMAYSVSLQAHEIGIRVALGAQRGGVLAMVLARGLRLLILGIILGEIASLVLTRLLARYVWGVSVRDPLTLVSIALISVAAGLVACMMAARKASRIDPMVALRYE